MKKHLIILLFSLFLGFDLKSQAIIIPTITPQPTANISPCYNIGFESMAVGYYTSVPGWTLASGNYTAAMMNGICMDYVSTATVNTAVGIVNTPYFNIPASAVPTLIPTSPFSGSKVLLARSDNIIIGINTVEKTFTVTNENTFFEYAYLFSLHYAHSTCCETPYIKIKLTDCVGNAIPCGSITAGGAGTNACVTVGLIPVLTNTISIFTPNWIINSFDLSAHVGSCVKIKLEVGSCVYGGHQSSIWFDSRCSESPISSNGTVNGNTVTVCQNPNIAALTSNAVNSCTWNGPPTSSIANISSSSISTSVSGVYSLSIFNPNCASTNTFTYLVNFCNIATSTKEDDNAKDIVIFPNPSSGNISIKGNKEIVLRLIDFSGREIDRFTITNSNGYTKDISGLSNGIYFILGNGIKEKVLIFKQ